ncbi:MAG: DNA polymerase IV [Desulfobulbus sp.]|jgi:DNA polymerase-4|uniref:DNA polymerase IV n=1 Tax=Desulfobulbus sp. TaxID=895 RepID=UPI002848FCCC|nr:DNA polymerase IV [Desulfobulbus sp.]MDR2548804.1 DNA polymerase IV [Desulfobulbus sp.]
MPSVRKIIHVDMDAFFASVEQLDRPELRGLPVIVGGDPGSRGVVAACSYQARVFGVHSAMPSGRAHQLCPQAVFVKPRMERYREISREIMALFHRYTPLVEPLSVDEAFLDVTDNQLGEPSATRVAELIRAAIRAGTGLTASAGVSYNKFLAKIASGHRKPDGLTVIPPDQAPSFLAVLPIGKFYGVGRVTERKMREHGIRTGADLLRHSPQELVALFGKSGRFFHDMARGIDHRPVEPVRVRKSIGSETTLATDIRALAEVDAVLRQQVLEVAEVLARKRTGGRTLTLKIRYGDFTTITRSCTTAQGFFDIADILACLPQLVAATEVGRRPVRLVGVTVGNLCDEREARQRRIRQLPLPFPEPVTTTATAPSTGRHGQGDQK